jgi:hypothetical protein
MRSYCKMMLTLHYCKNHEAGGLCSIVSCDKGFRKSSNLLCGFIYLVKTDKKTQYKARKLFITTF